MTHSIWRRLVSLLCTFLMIVTPLSITGCPGGVGLPSGGDLKPESFRGLAFYVDQPDGLIASIDVSSTKSIYVFGRLDVDLIPRDVYQLILTDDRAPENNMGIAFDSEGRLAELVVGSEVLATYTYSADGGTVTETTPDGASKSFAIDSSLSPQERLTLLGNQAGTDLSAFFDTFAITDGAGPAKEIRTRAEPRSIGLRALNAALAVVGLGLSVVGLVALAPEAGAAVMLLTVANHGMALLNTGLAMSQLFDETGRITSDPQVAQLEIGLATTAFILQPVTAGLDVSKRGIVILENADLWRDMAFNTVDLVFTVLINSPGAGGGRLNLPPGAAPPPDEAPSTGPTGSFTVLSYINTDGSFGFDPAGAPIQLSGSSSAPTMSWPGLSNVSVVVVIAASGPGTDQLIYGISGERLVGDEIVEVPLPTTVTYGNYTLPDTMRLSGTPTTAPPLVTGVGYTIQVITPSGQTAVLVFQVN